jgi:hypothetical protein
MHLLLAGGALDECIPADTGALPRRLRKCRHRGDRRTRLAVGTIDPCSAPAIGRFAMSPQIPIEPFSIPSDGESYPVGPGGQRPPAEPPSSGPPPPRPTRPEPSPLEPSPPEGPATPPRAEAPRRRSGRTALVVVAVAVVALLLGYGIGVRATHPAVTKAQSQRDTARQHLATTNTQVKSLQGELTGANAKVQSCQSLSTTATKVFTDWDTLVAASHAFDATEPGSTAEAQAGAELDRQFRSLDLEMQSAKQALAKCAPASNA